jgi:hypothetical protein
MFAHKSRRPFFSASLECNDHGHRIAKNSTDAGQGIETRDPIDVA